MPTSRHRLWPLSLLCCGALLLLSCGNEPSATVKQPPIVVDTTYPNNWRAPERTHGSYNMQSGNIPCPVESADVQYIDPLPVILDYAKSQRLVMVNESHTKMIHRLFIGELGKELFKQGYTHYGAELFGADNTDMLNAEDGLRERKYVDDSRPYLTYWGEPVYAQVLEGFAKLNYYFFSYEGDINSSPKGTQSLTEYRDSLQADNIIGYLEDHPEGKILIHAGYHHIKEANYSSNTKWMAEQLKGKHPIDPLTISQTDCIRDGRLEGGFLGYALLADGDGKPISRNGYDMIIAAPTAADYKQRPLWLRDHMGRRFVDVPDAAKFDGPSDFTLITAQRIDRPYPAAPEDIIYRAPFSDKVLALRPGTYDLSVMDRNKMQLTTARIAVE